MMTAGPNPWSLTASVPAFVSSPHRKPLASIVDSVEANSTSASLNGSSSGDRKNASAPHIRPSTHAISRSSSPYP